jgi:hypothetical protein
MLLFAIFTLGYLFGVFMVLAVYMGRDEVEGIWKPESAMTGECFKRMTSWEIFTQLTKPNYPKGFSRTRGIVARFFNNDKKQSNPLAPSV